MEEAASTARKMKEIGMEKYITKAQQMGAKNAVPFVIADIVFDPRVLLKCLFGCADFGKLHTCPYQRSPLSMEENRQIFQRYARGLIIGCDNKTDSQNISYEIERECYLDDYYLAISLSDCGLCNTCAKGKEAPCHFPVKARPAMQSVGIDVFKTVRTLGLPIEVLREKDAPQNWYSAVFVD